MNIKVGDRVRCTSAYLGMIGKVFIVDSIVLDNYLGFKGSPYGYHFSAFKRLCNKLPNNIRVV
jgi:hypothetical protein